MVERPQRAPQAGVAPEAGGTRGAREGSGGQVAGRPQGAEAGVTRLALVLLPAARGRSCQAWWSRDGRDG